ncbi:MAG TPA: hypothetical protein VLJ15_03880 [Gammaproteobacteria bacterium]|nr:hypothetical protein [Gammaproteobacteria bacterium]
MLSRTTRRLFATFSKTSGLVPLKKDKNILSFGRYDYYTSNDGMDQSVLAKTISVTDPDDHFRGLRKNISVTNRKEKTSLYMSLYPDSDPDTEQTSYIKLEENGKKEKSFFSKGNSLNLAKEIASFFKPLTPNKPHMEVMKNLCLAMTEPDPSADIEGVLKEAGHEIGQKYKGP